MKRTAFTALAAAALLSGPAFAQQAPNATPPGQNFLSSWDLDEDGQVTIEELKSRRADIFLSFDADEDGVLSPEEYDVLDAARMDGMQRPADRGQGLGRGEQTLRREAIDTNSDGNVTAEEYAAGAEAWLKVMDGNGDGRLTIDDFGPGARQAGLGQGQGRGNGQGMGSNQGMGQGRGNGLGQGQRMNQGYGQGQGQGKGQWQDGYGSDGTFGQGKFAGRGGSQGREMMQGRGHSGQRMPHGDMQRGGMGRGGMGQGQADRPAAFGAFPTADGGLWIVDSRTGDILFCRASVDDAAPAGFTPVCVEARK